MKSIALVSVTSVEIPEHCGALMHSARELRRSRPVDRVILFSDQDPPKNYTGEWVKLNGRMDILSYGRFQVRRLGRMWDQFIKTDFMLNIQADGFITNGGLWDDQFLEYDYIGAPWAKPQWDGKDAASGYRVGNSGFSIRSEKFMKKCAARWDQVFDRTSYTPYDDQGDDIWFCQINERWMRSEGIKYAPLDVAARFSLEQTIPEYPNRTTGDCFGQHGRLKMRVEEDTKLL